MSIANTNSASIAAWSASNPATASFDCSGGDILIVGVFTNGSTSALSVTYNGVSLTQLALITDAGNNKQGFYYLVNPSSGSNTLSVTRTGGTNVSVVASSYSGVDTANPIDDYSTDTGTSATTSWTCSSVTVSNANNWLVSTLRDVDNHVTSSDNVTFRVNSGAVLEELYDSYGAVGSTGSINVTYTISPASRLHGHVLISLTASGGGGGVVQPQYLGRFARL